MSQSRSRGWFKSAVIALLWTIGGTLALIGACSATAIGLLASNNLDLDRVAWLVGKVQEAYVWIGGVSATGIVGLFTRYGLPAWYELRRIAAQTATEALQASRDAHMRQIAREAALEAFASQGNA